MVAGRIARTFSSEPEKRFLSDSARSSTSWTMPGPFPRLVREKHTAFSFMRTIEASSLRLTKINGRSRASMLLLVRRATNHVNPASARVPTPTIKSPALMSGVMLMKATTDGTGDYPEPGANAHRTILVALTGLYCFKYRYFFLGRAVLASSAATSLVRVIAIFQVDEDPLAASNRLKTLILTLWSSSSSFLPTAVSSIGTSA